ncbi:MAG TPA: hypothetical protein ENJ32_14445 [Crenotrichaceae bacterium]|nr:hypothetical protein [Crenotrichaceae bacterium]
MKYSSKIICIVCVFLFCNQCNHNPVDTDSAKNTDLSLELLWQYPQEEAIFAEIAVVGDTLYVADSKKLAMLNTSGEILATFDLIKGPGFGKLIIDGDQICFGTSAHRGLNTAFLYLLDRHTLQPVWFKSEIAWAASPCVDENTVYYAGLNEVKALDRATGAEKWSRVTGGRTAYNPVREDNRLYFLTAAFRSDGFLYCLDAESGQIVFQDTLHDIESNGQFGGSVAGLTLSEDKIYVSSENRYFYCFNKQDGSLLWKFLGDSPLETTPALSDGIVYTGSLNRTSYALDAETGALLWSHQDDGSLKNDSPQFYKDYVMFVSSGILFYDKQTGYFYGDIGEKRGYGAWTATLTLDGHIYARTYDLHDGHKGYFSAFKLIEKEK